MPRQYNRRPGLRGVAEVAINAAGNPFAQLTRLANREPTHTQPVPQVNLPARWHIPANRGSPALRGGTMPNVVSDDDDSMEAAVQVAQAFGPSGPNPPAGAGAGKGAQETPVSIQRSHFGLPETVTQVLTGTNYFAVTCPANFQSMTRVQFRLTSIIDRMPVSPTAPVGGAAYLASTVYNSIMPPQSTFFVAGFASFVSK